MSGGTIYVVTGQYTHMGQNNVMTKGAHVNFKK